MTRHDSPPSNREMDSESGSSYGRRQILALGGGLGAVLLAGCSTQTDPTPGGTDEPTTETPDQTTESAGTFRLLVSDQPTAIGEFDRLDVSLSHARVFHAEGEGDGEDGEDEEANDAEEAENETETESEKEEEEEEDGDEGQNGNEDEEDEEGAGEKQGENGDEQEKDGEEGQGPSDSEEGGFFEIELSGATVDLTEVVGERAIRVFEGELQAGRYAKIELHVADVDGIVSGDPVAVKVPSEKLQIVKPFEVVAGETLSFVFDINVVKKGQTGEYNLLPVISKSGVAGDDVAVEEVDPEEEA